MAQGSARWQRERSVAVFGASEVGEHKELVPGKFRCASCQSALEWQAFPAAGGDHHLRATCSSALRLRSASGPIVAHLLRLLHYGHPAGRHARQWREQRFGCASAGSLSKHADSGTSRIVCHSRFFFSIFSLDALGAFCSLGAVRTSSRA